MLVALGGPLREKWLYAQPRDEENNLSGVHSSLSGGLEGGSQEGKGFSSPQANANHQRKP